MSSLSQRLHLGVQQKQILTPGLVQMVTVLQLNRLELKDMITQEIAENPVLEEAADGIEELAPEVESGGESGEAPEAVVNFELDGAAQVPVDGAATAPAAEPETTEPKTEK